MNSSSSQMNEICHIIGTATYLSTLNHQGKQAVKIMKEALNNCTKQPSKGYFKPPQYFPMRLLRKLLPHSLCS